MEGKSVWLSFLLTAMATFLSGQTLSGPKHNKVVVCYVGTWAVYRPKPGSFELDFIDPGLCTHLVYSFAGLDDQKNTIKSLDPWQDLEKDYGRNGYKRMVRMKERYPHLKVSIAIGGWNEGSYKYSKMAADPEKRKKFVESVLNFLNEYKFDGLDLDWEYPAKRDGRPEDKVNFVSLVKELNEAFEPHSYILTAAFGVGKDTMEVAYDLAKLSRYLDFIHMMCYDYHGTWDGVVGANAPLRAMEGDFLSVEYSIKYMLAQGVSPYKMVLGLPLYGRSFVLKDPKVDEVVFGQTAVESKGFAGPWTREAGFLGYNEICAELTNTSSKWTQHWDDVTATPYLRDGSRVICYDDERSISIKVKMAIEYGLGGLMVWSLDTDDFKGACESIADPYIDFKERLEDLNQDPIIDIVVQNMAGQSKRNMYLVDNGKLNINVPERKSKNYALMRTINEATVLAIEENKIMEEIEKINKENEIEDSGIKKKSGSNRILENGLVVVGSLALISGSLF